MKFFVIYDPKTGLITGRVNINVDEGQVWENALEISGDEYFSKPEVYKRVDVESGTLVDR